MTTARDEILQAVREATRRPACAVGDIAREAAELLAGIEGCRPALHGSDVVENFILRASGPKVGASIDRIASLSELPNAVARHLAKKEGLAEVVLQPVQPLRDLDWTAAGISLGALADDGIVVGLAQWGIAETGSVVFHSSRETPILHAFLCASHIVALPARGILANLDDYAAAARMAGDPAPRNACLITGASGTTDIEGSLVKGAHGPRDLHIIVVHN